MHCITALFVLTSMAAVGQSQALDRATMADIHVMITDGWGNQLPDAMVEFKPVGGWGRPRWMRYPKESRTALPPGVYVISVDAQGFRKYADTSEFSAGKSFIPLSLVLADIETPAPDRQPSLRGRVAKSLLMEPPFWIRIVGISAGAVRNIEIDDSGAFTVPDLLPGRYMIFVMNGGVLKDSRIVEVRTVSTIIGIDVPVKAVPR